MRDRSPREVRSFVTGTASEQRADPLARFVLDNRSFQLTICDANEPRGLTEVARFHLANLTIAVQEDFDPDKSLTKTREIIGKLTARELQIATMVAQGDPTKKIAYKLRISEWTVGTHLRRIFAKLNVDNRAAMVFRCAPLINDSVSVDR
jgi:DNA-binding CsgD family transcriptional regulator